MSATTSATTPESVRASLRSHLFIDGAFVAAPSTFEVLDPATGDVLGVAAAASVDQAHAAVAAAAAAFTTWKELSDEARAKWLNVLADEIEARKPRIATVEALNTGKPIREAEGDVDDAVAVLRYSAKLAENNLIKKIQTDSSLLPDPSFTGRIIYEPVGVVVGITPFNFPAMMACWKIGPALAAGCTIIIKPSEFTPFSSLELAAAAEAVGLPKGVLQVVTGDGRVGNELVVHPLTNKITFTGSVPTGAKVMKAASDGIKRVTLELGGKSPAIVFDDADIDGAIEWLVFGCMWNCGQICSATARVLVHESVAEEVTRRIVAAASKLKQGTSFEEGVDIGPNCNKMQYEKVQRYIELTKAEGATLLLGGGRPAGEKFTKGFWTAPTIFSGITPRNTIFREEVFGPVMSITTFKTVDEAIALANECEYGLAAAAFSRDTATLERCAKEIRAGVVWLNNAQPSPHAQPWGGFGKSGIGREVGPLGLLPFYEQKAVTGWPVGKPVGWYPESYFTK